MIRNRFLYIVCVIFCLQACGEDEQLREDPELDSEVKIGATVKNGEFVTKGDAEVNAAPDDNYYLYLPIGSFNTTDRVTHKFVCNKGVLTTDNLLHWDDIHPAAVQDETPFYLTNTKDTVFVDGTVQDILWGEAQGWLDPDPLNFTLEHRMSKLTFILKDKTLKGDVDFSKAKVELKQGLFRKAHKIDIKTGVVSIDTNAQRDATIIPVSSTEKTEEHSIALLELGIVPPQAFAENTDLEITAGEYVYRIPLPKEMNIEESKGDIALNAGEHLVITIILTEHTIDFRATIADWNEKEDLPEIDVNRVFNISNWQELKDLMLAVNTGYTFKGMVVRLTDNIIIVNQLSLGNKEYAFEGIFDGNGMTITGLGKTGDYNKGGFFAYTKGATIQNVTLIEPLVETGDMGATGALIDKAENSTIFNCKVLKNPENDAVGFVSGTVSYTGGLVGHAIGSTSFTNCYTTVMVKSVGSEYVGGLVGYSEGSINHCSSQDEVTASSSSYVGGLVGYATGSIINCFAWGSVSGFSKVGGLIGHMDALLSHSYAEGTVYKESAGIDCGGLLGSMGFYGDVKYGFWKYSGSYGGIGSATLDDTCESFSYSSTIVGDLNTNNAGIWYNDGSHAVFANQ